MAPWPLPWAWDPRDVGFVGLAVGGAAYVYLAAWLFVAPLLPNRAPTPDDKPVGTIAVPWPWPDPAIAVQVTCRLLLLLYSLLSGYTGIRILADSRRSFPFNAGKRAASETSL